MKVASGLVAVLSLLSLSSCDSSDFKGTSTSKNSVNSKAAGEGADKGKPSTGASNAKPSGEGVGGTQSVAFKYGPKLTPNDVLFVFDDSVSMGKYLANVRAGFDNLVSADWYGDTRIAVITTLPADPKTIDPSDPNKTPLPHPDVKQYSGIQFEPGFLSFVSAAMLEKFKLNAPALEVAAYSEPLCAEEWFTPTAVNSNKKRCLSVALQNPHFGVGCEAGMTALSQLHDRKGKVFRDGALAQIVFVSDAQDPGCGSEDLKASRPTAKNLREKVMTKNKLSGLRFHGVLPVEGGNKTKEIELEEDFGFPYNALIKENNGILIDILAGTDYSVFAKELAKSSLPEPVFPLPVRASKINGVKVGAELLAAEKVQLSSDGQSVRLLGLSPAKDIEIVIGFTP